MPNSKEFNLTDVDSMILQMLLSDFRIQVPIQTLTTLPVSLKMWQFMVVLVSVYILNKLKTCISITMCFSGPENSQFMWRKLLVVTISQIMFSLVLEKEINQQVLLMQQKWLMMSPHMSNISLLIIRISILLLMFLETQHRDHKVKVLFYHLYLANILIDIHF